MSLAFMMSGAQSRANYPLCVSHFMTADDFTKLCQLLDLDDGPCFCVNGKLLVNCNDFFCPAADAEEVTYEELPQFLATVHDYNDAVAWVAAKRGVALVRWRDK